MLIDSILRRKNFQLTFIFKFQAINSIVSNLTAHEDLITLSFQDSTEQGFDQATKIWSHRIL